MTGIAPNILSDRLRRLERARDPRRDAVLAQAGRGWSTRSRADGRELAGALHLLADWGVRRGGPGEPLRHAVCGTPLEARWHCPTCGLLVEDAEPDGLTRL